MILRFIYSEAVLVGLVFVMSVQQTTGATPTQHRAQHSSPVTTDFNPHP